MRHKTDVGHEDFSLVSGLLLQTHDSNYVSYTFNYSVCLVWVCAHISSSAHGIQKRVSDPMDLALKSAERHKA